MKAEEPKYLFKILTPSQWQATQRKKTLFLAAEDDEFIHLASESQLDKIIAKYWSDINEYVILKVQTDRLEGDLVYEANPNGATKYYHLYNGCIPINSIVESKVISRKPFDHGDLSGIAIVQMGHPALRQPAKGLSKEEILSPKIQQLIIDMKSAMSATLGVGLAAPQVGQSLQITVIEDVDHSHLTPEQLLERERFPVPFHVIINPKIYLEGTETAEFFEGCLSIPGLVGVVPRAKQVRVECLNERAEPVTINAKGWYARILQHEIDHLNATLYLDRAFLPSVMTEENFIKFWKGKPVREILEHLVL